MLLLSLFSILFQQAAAQRLNTVKSLDQFTGGIMSTSAPELIVRAIDRDMNTFVGPPEEFLSNRIAGTTFDVTYIGFPANAETAFQYAVDIWAASVTSTVTIRVTARWTALDPGVLGSASAQSLVRDFSGAPVSGTWYPISLAEKLAGGDLNPIDSADIKANFNSTVSNWYFGTDGNPPSGQFDMVSVVLHELGHGLGFFGSMSVTGGIGSWGSGTGFPFIYDRFAENGSNQQLINTTIFPNPSAALGTQLTSNDIFFDGPNATPANGGTPPKLYCPSTWTSGSSFSHLDETTFPAGNPNSLMTPAIGMAEAIHSAGVVTLGMFEDWGWTTTPPPPSNVKWEEIFGGTMIPPGWRVVDNDGSGDFWSFIQGLTSGGDTLVAQAGVSFWWSNWTNANSNDLLDEWIIGPRIPNIVSGDSLYFWAGAIDQGFDDSLKVFISTTDSLLGSFTNQIAYFKVDGPFGSWHQYGFDLSPFDGEDIFIGVNYYLVDAVNNADNVWVDHFLITTDNPSAVDEGDVTAPTEFVLHQNYPNPFNPSTTFSFSILNSSFAILSVYDLLGREVATIINEELPPGVYTRAWDASDQASGVYFYRLKAGDYVATKKLVLMR